MRCMYLGTAAAVLPAIAEQSRAGMLLLVAPGGSADTTAQHMLANWLLIHSM
jgi:hypothetical protein